MWTVVLQRYNSRNGLDPNIISMSTVLVSKPGALSCSHSGTCLSELGVQSIPLAAAMVPRRAYT